MLEVAGGIVLAVFFLAALPAILAALRAILPTLVMLAALGAISLFAPPGIWANSLLVAWCAAVAFWWWVKPRKAA